MALKFVLYFSLTVGLSGSNTKSNTDLLKRQCGRLKNPHFFTNGICYELHRKKLYFYKALESGCLRIPNGHLAFINHIRLTNFVKIYFSKYKSESKFGWSYFWVGLKQLDTSIEPNFGWYWMRNSENYEIATNRTLPWGKNEPNNIEMAEHCGASVVELDGKLADFNCHVYAFYPICQYNPCQKDLETCVKQACSTGSAFASYCTGISRHTIPSIAVPTPEKLPNVSGIDIVDVRAERFSVNFENTNSTNVNGCQRNVFAVSFVIFLHILF